MAGEPAGSPILEAVLSLTLTLSTGLPATYKLHVVITFIALHILAIQKVMRFIVNYKVSTLLCLHKSFPVKEQFCLYIRIYAEVINYKGLTCCSKCISINEIHSQLQEITRYLLFLCFA